MGSSPSFGSMFFGDEVYLLLSITHKVYSYDKNRKVNDSLGAVSYARTRLTLAE